MSERTALIERERKKLQWLREKVALQEARVRAAEALTDDPLDEMFDREVSLRPSVQVAPTPEPPAEPVPARPLIRRTVNDAERERLVRLLQPVDAKAWTRRPRHLPEKWVRVFSFIGQTGKTNPELVEFVEREGIDLTPEAMRAQLMNYRKDFGLIDNPRRGFYALTPKALEILRVQENESLATE